MDRALRDLRVAGDMGQRDHDPQILGDAAPRAVPPFGSTPVAQPITAGGLTAELPCYRSASTTALVRWPWRGDNAARETSRGDERVAPESM